MLSKFLNKTPKSFLRAAFILKTNVRFEGHARIFRIRPGSLTIARIKDTAHFYMIILGTLPWIILGVGANIVCGPCELRDYPDDGSEPRFWQFERTPLRQLFTRYIGKSAMEMHERNMSFQEYQGTLYKWRQILERVTHLQAERWDYKAWYYIPIKTKWIEHAKWYAELQKNDLENARRYLE